MAEKAFHTPQMTLNGFQDPMGNDAHQGLELFLDKFHQPGVPSHTIITDPEYYVFLWFHNALGELIDCPYTDGGKHYVPRLSSTSVDFDNVNKSFYDKKGIQSGVDDQSLPSKCFDLTPFVRSIQMPEIAPANGEQIDTLFGKTTAGSFSPYASDGSKPITLEILDTEYSILDGIFYPWMKDINSPWWYRPDKVYSEWATPYPMATLEVQRPRMRYKSQFGKDGGMQSRIEQGYVYYSYKFLGVKPTQYSGFEVNGSGRSNLLRSLTMICDMCLVDLTHDSAGTSESSTNLGNRTQFIFSQLPDFQYDDQEEENKKLLDEDRKANEEASKQFQEQMKKEQENQEDVEQQDDGEQPGEEEPETGENPDENIDQYGDNYTNPDECDQSDVDDDENPNGEGNDGPPPFEPGEESNEESNLDAEKLANEAAAEEYLDEMAKLDAEGAPSVNDDNPVEQENEKGFFDSVMDTMGDIGSGIADAAGEAAGWVADGAESAMGLVSDVAGEAVGAAADIAGSAIDVASDVAGGALDVASGVAQSAAGVAGNLASTALSAASGVSGTAIDAAGGLLGSASTAAGSALGAVGSAAGGLLGGLGSMFGSAATGATSLAGSALGGASSIAGSALNSASGVANSLLGGGSGSSSGGLFGALGSALSGASKLGSTAFGVVSNVASSSVGLAGNVTQAAIGSASKTTSPATTLLGGVLDNGMKTAFSAIGNGVGKAGNMLGGAMSFMGDAASKPVNQISGAINQSVQATNQVRNSGMVTGALNSASRGIASTIGSVGNMATSVVQNGTSLAASGISSIGNLAKSVERMTSSRGNKPTPIESYVTMVANSNSKSPTMT